MLCSRGSRQAPLELGYHHGPLRHANQDIATSQLRLAASKPFSNHALDAIAVDRARQHPLGNDEAQPRDAERVCFEQHAETGALDGSPSGEQGNDIGGPESLPAGEAPVLAQTARRARPFARRARSTARPPRVRIRTRNPWVRFLRITEG
jgi:hypothetical protein